MKFVRTLEGELVNLSRVEAIRRNGRSETGLLIGIDGQMGTISWDNAQKLMGDLVPAAAGLFVTTISVVDLEDCDGIPANRCIISRYPIAAWRIYGEVAEPVLPQQTALDEVVLIELPEGRLLEPDMGEYDSLEDAKLALISRADEREARLKARQAFTSGEAGRHGKG